jgi:hypothetical protein
VRRNNRTKLATILTAAMIMGTLPGQAFAEAADSGGASAAAGSETAVQSGTNAQITKVKAEALARQYVNIPKEYTLQGTGFSSEQLAVGKRNTWSLDFVKKVNGKQQGSIYVRIHADNGQLLEFRTYVDNPSAKPTYPLKVERDAAQKLALEFIHTLAPNYESQVKLNTEYGVSLLPPLTGQVRHTLRFDRIVNGIPYADNYIEAEIDSEGHMMSYSLRWDETIVFPKVSTTLTAEQADAKLRAAAKPELVYIIPYSAKGERKPVLSYKLDSLAIDAVSGDTKDRTNISYYRQGTVSTTPLTAKPDGTKPSNSNITEQRAVELVKAAFKLPADAVLSHSNYSENKDEYSGKTNAYWDLNWTITKDGKEQGFLSATVDGQSGAIRNFYNYNYSASPEKAETDKAPVSLQQAMELASATVKKQLPWLTHELYIVSPKPETYEGKTAGEIGSYRIEFVRKVHGATVEYDNVGVSIDSRTGEVTDYNGNIADFDYPASPPGVITKDAAISKWLGYYRTELAYQLVQQYWWEGQPIPYQKMLVLIAAGEASESQLTTKNEAELVYRLVPRPLDESIFLDAETGSWRNRETGEATQLEKPKATDIEGHWAQRQLELMVAYKALDVKDGKVRPSEQVTRGELIKMLVLARNSGNSPMYDMGTASAALEKASFDDVAADSSYFVYVESALAQNLIDIGDGSFNPDGKVSRDEMSELIVRALGYNALAEYDHIFKASFKDSDQIENKGQAAIVVGLKIMSLSDGKFLPGKLVTRAEASVAFFRYLQTRADLAEAPLRM